MTVSRRPTRVAVALVGLAAVVAAACSGGLLSRGQGAPLGLDVAAVDRAEVREVVAVADEGPEGTSDDQQRHPTSFGAYAVTIGAVPADDLGPLLDEVAGVRLIDTGSVDYDIANPDLEVVFFQGDTELGRLGYYRILSEWGSFRVPGRWIDDRWQLLAMTTEIREDALEE